MKLHMALLSGMLLFLGMDLVLGQAGWKELDTQTEELYKKGDLEQAARTAKLALGMAATEGQMGRSLDRLGFLQYSLGQRAEGEATLTQALEIRERLGHETEDCADTLINLAMVKRDLRQLDEALKLASEGTAIRARLLGRSSPLYAEGLNILGTVYYYRGEYETAYATHDEALRIHELQLDAEKPSEEYGTLCTNFANVAQRLGRYQRAAELFQKALDALRKNPGPDHPAYSVTLAGAAFLQQDLGNYDVAEKSYVEALQLLEKQLGKSHPLVGTAYSNLGVLYQTLGDRAAAEASYLQALEIKRTAGGLSLAVTLRNYGRLLLDRDAAASEKMCREASAIMEQMTSAPAYERANALLSLAEAQLELRRYNEAGPNLEQALKLVETTLGARHPLYSAILRQQGRLAEALGLQADAHQKFQRAIGIVTASKGGAHPELVEYLLDLASLESRHGHFQPALDLFRRASRIQEDVQAQALAVGSESAKVAMLASLDGFLPAAIAFQAAAGAQLPEARQLAFDAVIRRKARVLEFIRDWRTRLRAQAGPSTQPVLDEWQALVECQAALTVALGYKDWRRAPAGNCALRASELQGRYEGLTEQLRQNWTEAGAAQALAAIQDLHQRAEGLEARLSRELPAFRQEAGRVTAKEVAAGLGQDELLIEIIRYEAGTRSKPQPRYGAFVLDAGAHLEWAELGPTRAIDTAVRDVLQAADDWSVSRAHQELPAAAQQTATNAMGRLSVQAFAPLWALLAKRGKAARLRIAPDGLLLLLPFEALIEDSRPLVARYAISYLLSGRELAAAPHSEGGSEGSLIAVSPGLARTAAARATFRADKLERLPGAQAEAEELLKLMPQARFLGENQATEQRLKLVHGPAVIHIVGHGMVRGMDACDQRSARAECAVTPLDPYTRIMNLSAIMLEEAYGRGAGSIQDGILTAQELSNIDLGATQMLVLSQCRMADGIPTSGDGIYGMRRGASLAGAKSFVAPLWKVDDSAQLRLMKRFYQELSTGQDRAQALRRGKLQLMRTPQTAHFLYWAPTILSGRIEPLPAAVFAPARAGVTTEHAR
ncbi:CHAT domain-containing tetratricopeptide repeat protein [Paludibaculum fermentans]|uniref:CHAT domain-containing tetratricopeptide repeat protein n=1 Tax=Paludibaculum fermentans TaxID=1473598 RepID=UPI003EC12DBC